MPQHITVRLLTPFRALIAAVLLLIGVLLGLLIGKAIVLILLMLPGAFYCTYLMFWVLELNTETGIFGYSNLFHGVRSFRIEDIRSKRVFNNHYQTLGEQYEIYVYKKGEDGMSERICMPLSNAEALREYLEHTEQKTQPAESE